MYWDPQPWFKSPNVLVPCCRVGGCSLAGGPGTARSGTPASAWRTLWSSPSSQTSTRSPWPTPTGSQVGSCHKEEGFKERREGKGRRCCLGNICNWYNSMPTKLFCIRMILKKGMNSSYLYIVLVQFILFFKSSYRGKAIAARIWINSALSSSSDDLCLLFCFYPSFMAAGLKQTKNRN